MTGRPGLAAAIAARLAEQEKKREEATAPEQEARDKQAAADARLYGTAGWDALGPRRRHFATQHAARQVEGGGDDAA
ncbi:hypothetical protein ABTX35_11965 [Streptomyces sp. NPDC096080]|uniref:hypothetical protein n=1 Tax=Streptomyces sp. NPDC096080 TaxID=3156693 RepID=UPI0033313FFB